MAARLHAQQIKRMALEQELVIAKQARSEAKTAAHPSGHTSSAANSLLRPGATKSFESLEASMSAQIGLAIAPLGSGGMRTFGSLKTGHAWSSIKVPILVTLMRDRGTQGLTSEERGWAVDALESSDNMAAANLFGQLERIHGGLAGASEAVEDVLRHSGDRSTIVATAPPPAGALSTYGQTNWSLEGSTAFYRALARGCLMNRSATDYVLGLMREVVPEQRWGLGEAGFDPTWRIGMKGGWGPEADSGGYLVRQAGIVQSASSGIALTMVAKDASGSFEAGTADLTRLANWLNENLRSLGDSTKGC